MDKALRDHQALTLLVQYGAIGHMNLFEFDLGMIARHVEGPVVVQDIVTFGVGWDDEGVFNYEGVQCRNQ